MKHLLLGTAGHIDHGKTSLVQALTGVDTDRLPQEKQRQITIDLGFAPLAIGEFEIGIVDVPGHERFVRNMLAGATGVDLAMLVVAADDSVKPQTREHLEILNHLGIKRGVIVITKCDLAAPEWIELVESEIAELVEGTLLADAPLVQVSAQTGGGIDTLREQIEAVAEQAIAQREEASEGSFRLAIDRVFTVAGFGTIVTGSAASGRISVGDELELQPSGRTVGVRGLQSHDQAVEQAGRGQRVAVNLSGIHYDELARGEILCSPGTLRPSQLLTVKLRISQQILHAVKHRCAVRVHLGTASIPAKIALLGALQAEPGEALYAQLFLSQSVAAYWGQPFILRSVSPVVTLGGGRVLQPMAEKLKHSDESNRPWLDALAGDDSRERVVAAAIASRLHGLKAADLPTLAGGTNEEKIVDQLAQEGLLVSISPSNSETIYLHNQAVVDLSQRILLLLEQGHQNTPLKEYVEVSRLSKHFRSVRIGLFESICSRLQEHGVIRIKKQGLALAGWRPQLSETQQAVLNELQTRYQQAQLQPPSVEQLAESLQAPLENTAEMVDFAVQAGLLVRISSEVLLDAQVFKQAQSLVTEKLREQNELSVSQVRELLGTSRRIAVPLCEHLDAIGLTCRHGDVRRLVNRTTTTNQSTLQETSH